MHKLSRTSIAFKKGIHIELLVIDFVRPRRQSHRHLERGQVQLHAEVMRPLDKAAPFGECPVFGTGIRDDNAQSFRAQWNDPKHFVVQLAADALSALIRSDEQRECCPVWFGFVAAGPIESQPFAVFIFGDANCGPFFLLLVIFLEPGFGRYFVLDAGEPGGELGKVAVRFGGAEMDGLHLFLSV
jgi:hypothetical protein